MSEVNRPPVTRRQALRGSLLAGMWFAGRRSAPFPRWLLSPTAAAHDGTLLGVVPFSDEGNPPMAMPIGSELDGRLFTDLSTFMPENAVTPPELFFIRTRASKRLGPLPAWKVEVSGLANRPFAIAAEALAHKARPLGTHLMECSGNTRSAHFGMMSIAAWHGVPLREILDVAGTRSPGARVLVSGFDEYQEESMDSVPGASWIFSREELLSARAFLATQMGGHPLTTDHGAPVRLLVPGWYGCVCIKWVKRIELVPEDAPATSQMQEYAGRTLQTGVPPLARDYRPAIMGAAAMPVRVEKWRAGGKIRYRIIGIRWGSVGPSPGCEIRFNPEEPFVRVASVKSLAGGDWSCWSHDWIPPGAKKFTIRLRVEAPDTRKLDAGYYDRSFEITEA
jgi:DMSO/TMAO reductase YedYZ molybdopterin-dependent catalytic subunit